MERTVESAFSRSVGPFLLRLGCLPKRRVGPVEGEGVYGSNGDVRVDGAIRDPREVVHKFDHRVVVLAVSVGEEQLVDRLDGQNIRVVESNTHLVQERVRLHHIASLLASLSQVSKELLSRMSTGREDEETGKASPRLDLHILEKMLETLTEVGARRLLEGSESGVAEGGVCLAVLEGDKSAIRRETVDDDGQMSECLLERNEQVSLDLP